MTKDSPTKRTNYSHCPIKKRPVNLVLAEEVPDNEVEVEEIVVNDTPEPENLSTKPQDLTCATTPVKRPRSCSPGSSNSVIESASRTNSNRLYRPYYPSTPISPATAEAPVQPIEKKARVEVDHNKSYPSPAGPLNSYTWNGIAPPIHTAGYLPHPSIYPHVSDRHPSYPVAASYPLSSPEHHSLPPAPYLPPFTEHRPHPPTTFPMPSPEHCLLPLTPYPMLSSEHRLLSPAFYPLPSPEHHSLPPTSTGTVHRPIARPWTSPENRAPSPTLSPALSPVSVSFHSTTQASGEDLAISSDSGRSSVDSMFVDVDSRTNSSSVDSASGSRHQCPACAKSYSTISGLSKHQQFHCAAAAAEAGQPKKTFTCKYCEKVYMTLGALKMHIRTHTLPCKCHLCGKAFSRPWLLQGHIRTHTGEKPFSCQHCQRAFADRSNLRAHLQTHSDVKKYSCPACSKTFSRMSLLSKHQEAGCACAQATLPSYC